MNKNKPFYLVKSDDEIVQNWKQTFEKLATSQDDLVFTVNPSNIAEGRVGFVQQMVIALQHYPHLIERMLFSLKFRFMLVDDVGVEISEDEWKMKPEVYQWFFEMLSIPSMVFFIKDNDARFYIMMGDVFSSGKFEYETDPRSKNLGIKFNEEQLNLLARRLFNSAWSFFIYCHGTGFDPYPYVDALLADFNMPFTAADVKKSSEESIERGVQNIFSQK